MKKLLPPALIVIMLALIISCCFISCRKGNEDSNESSTETGTVANSSHLSPGESQENDSDINETEGNTPVMKPVDTEIENSTEKETEKATENKKVEATEKEPETETETETEPVPEEPKVSLDYVSFGNGTCSVSGIGNCIDVCVIIPERSPAGDIVTAIGEKAFFENTDIKAVQIPSTVTEIGNLAFGGCTSIVYISVDDNNRAFCDSEGILFSLDKTELIAYPAASGTSKLDISASVEKIHDMAFYGCDNLELINYAGTLAQWGKIKIGESNYGLYTASIYCSDYKK
jgi:hypothetical protein